MALYSALKINKTISKKLFLSYSKKYSPLEEHPSPKCPGIDVATGSLGHGICVAGGIALANKMKNKKILYSFYVAMEKLTREVFWEAVMFAAHNNLDNLKILIDHNKWQATGRTRDVLNLESYKKNFNL